MSKAAKPAVAVSVPLSFAIGVSPGPRPGARDPEGGDALETLARDGVNLIRLPKMDERELEGQSPGAGRLPPSVHYVQDNLDTLEARRERLSGDPLLVDGLLPWQVRVSHAL